MIDLAYGAMWAVFLIVGTCGVWLAIRGILEFAIWWSTR